MTVAELIEKLRVMPQDADVVIAGGISEHAPNVALVSEQSGGIGGWSAVVHRVVL